MHETRKNLVAQLTNTCRLVGCHAVGLSLSWLAPRYLHERKIRYISDMTFSLQISDIYHRY